MSQRPNVPRSDIRAAASSANRWLIATTLSLVAFSIALMLLGLLDWPSSEASPFPVGERTLRDGSWIPVGVAAFALVGVAFLLGGLRVSRSERTKAVELWLLAAFGVFSLATLVAGWLQVHSTLRAFRAVRMEEQVAIARGKAVHIDDWTAERLVNLRYLVESLRPFPLAGSVARPEAVALSELVLAQFLSSYPERAAVGIFKPDGQPVIVQGRFDSTFAAKLREDIVETARRNKPYISVIQPGGVRESGLSLTFLAPLNTREAPGADALVVAFVVDPTITLLRKFSDWPLAGKGVLTLLFRSGGEAVHIVDAGKEMGPETLSLRAPIPEERLGKMPSDTRGEASWLGIGRDGQQTLTAAYAVKDMPWTVVARTDLQDAMAPISRQIWALWAATAVVIGFGGLLLLTVKGQLKLSRLLAQV